MSDNPKQLEGAKKVPFSCLPWRVIGRLAVAMAEGVKYGYHNYRRAGAIYDSTYFDATMRHLLDHHEGTTIDPHSPSGRTNLEAAMASLAVWIDAIHSGTYVDDRPPRTISHSTWLDDLNTRTVLITENTPKSTPRYTEKDHPLHVTPEFPGACYGKREDGVYARVPYHHSTWARLGG